MRIDAHHHFWRVEEASAYPWLSPDQAVLYRSYGPEDLQPLLAQNGIDGTILVQAAPTLSETRELLRIAEQTPFVLGVVGWCDFEGSVATELIQELAREPKLRGLRPMVQDIADDDWLLRHSLRPALAEMVRLGLVFDALVRPNHLCKVNALAQCHPTLSIVVDHGAKPEIAAGDFDAWLQDIASVANNPNVVCKLSGLVTECGECWSLAQLNPVVQHLLACFGPGRLLWGSDWPVLNLAATYKEWMFATDQLLTSLSSTERAAIFGENAYRIYIKNNNSVLNA
jgi:L-fuconolactonase